MNTDTERALDTIGDWRDLLNTFLPEDTQFQKLMKGKIRDMEDDLQISYTKCINLIHEIQSNCNDTVGICVKNGMKPTSDSRGWQFFRGKAQKAMDVLDMIKKAEVIHGFDS